MTQKKKNDLVDVIKSGMDPLTKYISVAENGASQKYSVTRTGVGLIKTGFGIFWEFAFELDDKWIDYTVIVRANIDNRTLTPVFSKRDELIVRIDSGCVTGQVFGDLTCDCLEQLHLAMKTIAEAGEGIIIHIPRQDGRGMGIPFKLATLWLQEALDMDTIEAASMLTTSGDIDVRTYAGAIGILKFFDISKTSSINLATDNPKKASVFSENGYSIANYFPMHIKSHKNTKRHLKAKKKYLNSSKQV